MLGQDDNPGNMEQEIQRSKAQVEEDLKAGIPSRDHMDPRSFLAKSVPQRMAIISAGVIFNLIFAVIFAAVAFKSGVKYNLAVVGEVTPGGPAWESNLYGASIKKVGDAKVEGYYPFIDLAQAVALNAGKEPIDLEYTLPGEQDIRQVSVMPRTGLTDVTDLALIGIERLTIPRIDGDPAEVIPGHPAASATPSFQDKDLIVGLDGAKIENSFDLKRLLAKSFDKAVTMKVSRNVDGVEQTVDIQVESNPRRETGLVMKWGPVKSIQKKSPAEEAGFQIGDQVVAIDGGPIGDLYTLEQRMTWLARDGKSAKFKISRDGSELELELKPRLPIHFSGQQTFQPVAVNSLGLAIQSSRFVADSNIQGIEAGDEITKIEFPLVDESEKNVFKARKIVRNYIELSDERAGWEMVDPIIQVLPADFHIKLFAKRDGKDVEAEASTYASTSHFLPTRGVGFDALRRNL